jgi:hypothetical protein
LSRLAHSVDWHVLFLDGTGYYPCMSTASRSGMGRRVASNLMYPEAHEMADRLNRRDGIAGAPVYSPRDEGE